MLTHFSLFSGVGGIDLAAEWAGFKTVGQCEIDNYAAKVLEKNFPDVKRWRDIRDVTADEFYRLCGIKPGGLTLLSGGFPCQPHSLAGKRLASADERDLWGEFARVIRETRPKWVLGENVRGLLSSENGRFFGRILRDFSRMGYDVRWCTYGAVNVGAPHLRERVFIVANTGCTLRQRSFIRSENEEEIEGRVANFTKRPSGTFKYDVPDTESVHAQGQHNEQGEIKPWGSSWWTTEPNVGRVAHGVPSRVDRLKCLGNAVVPQQVYPILEAMAKIERSKNE